MYIKKIITVLILLPVVINAEGGGDGGGGGVSNSFGTHSIAGQEMDVSQTAATEGPSVSAAPSGDGSSTGTEGAGGDPGGVPGEPTSPPAPPITSDLSVHADGPASLSRFTVGESVEFLGSVHNELSEEFLGISENHRFDLELRIDFNDNGCNVIPTDVIIPIPGASLVDLEEGDIAQFSETRSFNTTGFHCYAWTISNFSGFDDEDSSNNQSIATGGKKRFYVDPGDTQCTDGVDNDGDGLSDADDPGCEGGGGDDDNEVDPPTVVLTATPVTINTGDEVTLTWSVDNATNCTASNGWSGNKNNSGGTEVITEDIVGSVSYTLTCAGPGGSDVDSDTVVVSHQSCSAAGFTADPQIVRKGDTSVLTVVPVHAAAVCVLTGPSGVNQSIDAAGSCGATTVDVTPTNTGTYTLDCGIDGTFTQRVQVLPTIQET